MPPSLALRGWGSTPAISTKFDLTVALAIKVFFVDNVF
jgi:hypothetical protein